MSVKVTVESENSQCKVQLSGRLDDDDLDISLAPIIKNLILDLSELEGINSIGIRAWVLWISSLPSIDKVVVHNCPWFFIEQALILTSALPPNTKINSMNLPYSCMACDNIENVTIDMSERPKDSDLMIGQTKSCIHCGKTAELDVLPEHLSHALDKF